MLNLHPDFSVHSALLSVVPDDKSAVSQIASSLSFSLSNGSNLSMKIEWVATLVF